MVVPSGHCQLSLSKIKWLGSLMSQQQVNKTTLKITSSAKLLQGAAGKH